MLFNDNIAQPYVYKLTHKNTNEYYFGYREANTVSCLDDIGIKYFTSSEYVQKIGFENFHIEIMCECKTGDEAYDIEQILIYACWTDQLLLNKHCVDIYTNINRFKCYGHSDEDKEKMRKNHYNNSGKNNPRYDTQIYHWYHIDGKEEICTQYELRKKYNLGFISSVLSGKNQSYKGWALIPNNLRKPLRKLSSKKASMIYAENCRIKRLTSPKYQWYNVVTGEKNKYSKYELIEKYDLTKSGINHVIAGRAKKHKN